MASMRILIVGLGNLDRIATRHSVGMSLVDHMASRLSLGWGADRRIKGVVASSCFTMEEGVRKVDLHLVKSRLPMNLSGITVRKAVDLYDVNNQCVFLIHDELDMPVGKSRIKTSGSALGHNGVRSVFDSLKSNNVPRLMIGIGRPNDKRHVARYVLEDFTQDEKSVVEKIFDNSIGDLFQLIATRCNVEGFTRDFLGRMDISIKDRTSKNKLMQKVNNSQNIQCKNEVDSIAGSKNSHGEVLSQNTKAELLEEHSRRVFSSHSDIGSHNNLKEAPYDSSPCNTVNSSNSPIEMQSKQQINVTEDIGLCKTVNSCSDSIENSTLQQTNVKFQAERQTSLTDVISRSCDEDSTRFER